MKADREANLHRAFESRNEEFLQHHPELREGNFVDFHSKLKSRATCLCETNSQKIRHLFQVYEYTQTLSADQETQLKLQILRLTNFSSQLKELLQVQLQADVNESIAQLASMTRSLDDLEQQCPKYWNFDG